MEKVYSFLTTRLPLIDVNSNGSIRHDFLSLKQIRQYLPDVPSEAFQEMQTIYRYVSGHGVVAKEYNERMIRYGRRQDAKYDKIDFTEPQVFIVAMDLLQSDLSQ
jgi:hypothetical protein